MIRRPLGALLALLLAALPVAAAVDPFYRARMESGVRAYERGNREEAARQLRIACFGYLDEPVALAAGLMRLAVVLATLDDGDGFRRIFSRMIELEERFSAYSQATVPDGLRTRFESLAARLVPEQTLRSTPLFQAIAERAVIQRLAAVPPDRRRAELEALIAAEPQEPDWSIEMARLELELRRPRLALDWLDRLQGEVAVTPPALCLRQQAATESKSCDRADLGRPFCAGVPGIVVEFRLECLVEAQRWAEAAELLAELPAAGRSRRVARLARRVDKRLPAEAGNRPASIAAPEAEAETTRFSPAEEMTAAEPAPTPTAPVPTPESPEAVSETAAAEPAPDAQVLADLRRRLAAASSRPQLVELMTEAESLADRHSGAREAQLLAAEIAYLQSDWPRTVDYFERAGDLRPGEAHLAFYHAVALYETGQAAAAAAVLRPVASRLERTGFVGSYLDRILGQEAPAASPDDTRDGI